MYTRLAADRKIRWRALLFSAALSTGVTLLSAPLAGAEPSPLDRVKPPQLSEGDFARIDADHNGVITRNEWALAGWDPVYFTKADVNFDGKVTLQEFMLWAKTIYVPEKE